jgi:hypothetical protein
MKKATSYQLPAPSFQLNQLQVRNSCGKNRHLAVGNRQSAKSKGKTSYQLPATGYQLPAERQQQHHKRSC